MRRAALTVGLTAALFLAGATQASAQDGLVGAFKALCYDRPGDATGTLAAAEAAGWDPAPRGMIETAGARFENAQGRIRSSEDGVTILFTGIVTQDLEGTPVKMLACLVAGMPVVDDFGETFRQWVGANPLTAFGQADINLYGLEVQAEGGRVARGDLNSLQAVRLLLDNRLHVMAGQNQDGLSMAMYMVPSIPE